MSIHHQTGQIKTRLLFIKKTVKKVWAVSWTHFFFTSNFYHSFFLHFIGSPVLVEINNTIYFWNRVYTLNLLWCYSYVDELLYWSGKRMKLDDFLQKEIIPQRLPSMWINSKKFVFQSDDGGLAVLDTATNTVSTLVTNHTIVSRRVSHACGFV